ncbi:hypothetical protein LTR13_010994 [Exophiala sideris]|nr:hypothetical protein LTR13_010994 [Exophiala sideris]KAK5186732.1 hypothetical protein LTR44_000738 [Eurotiomycetes sp. CCFEE 6388]
MLPDSDFRIAGIVAAKTGHLVSNCPKLAANGKLPQSNVNSQPPTESIFGRIPPIITHGPPPAKKRRQNSSSTTHSAPDPASVQPSQPTASSQPFPQSMSSGIPPIITHGPPPAKKRHHNSSTTTHSSDPKSAQPKRRAVIVETVVFTQEEKDRAEEAVSIHHTIYLPHFRTLAQHMLQHLCSDACPPIFNHYRVYIVEVGLEILLEDLMSAIDPEILALGGQDINRDSLEGVIRSQKDKPGLFDCDGGYMNIITDSRNYWYFRLYIGQGQVIEIRIHQHKESIASECITSLHYYIILTGGEFRKSNFIRLYHLRQDPSLLKGDATEQEVKQFNEVRRTLLELLMTLAFQTLPATELEQWLTEKFIKYPLRTLHLNVLNPLYQIKTVGVAVYTRQSSREQLRLSEDPQIASWPDIRVRQIKDQRKQQTQNLGSYPKLSQMGEILQAAIEDNRSTLGALDIPRFPIDPVVNNSEILSIDDRLRDLQAQLHRSGVSLLRDEFYTPIGDLNSPLVIVLNQALLPKYDRRSSATSFLPITFEEMGLTDGQILIWPFNLQSQSSNTTEVQVLPSQANSEGTAFKDFSQGLFHDSRATFILITEGLAERSLLNTNALLSPEFQITLRSFKVKTRLLIRDNRVQKVVLVIPDLVCLYSQGDWRSCQRFTHSLRMATLLSGAQGNKWRLFEHRGAHGMILRAYAAKDLESVSLNTLDHFIVDWLYRKGFRTAQDVEELQDLAPTKSLAEACFMLMVLLPKDTFKQIDRKVFEVRKDRSTTKKPRKFSEDVAIAVRQLFEKKINSLIKDDPDQPSLPDGVKTHNDSLIIPPADEQLDEASDGPLEAHVAEIMTMLEDGSGAVESDSSVVSTTGTPDSHSRRQNIEALSGSIVSGVQQREYPDLANTTLPEYWGRQKEEVVNGLLSGRKRFKLRAEKEPYISLPGWRIRIKADFPRNDIKSVRVKADISSPDTQHEHTCFGSRVPRLRRLAFWITVKSATGQSAFWARRTKVRRLESAAQLFDTLLARGCGGGEEEGSDGIEEDSSDGIEEDSSDGDEEGT